MKIFLIKYLVCPKCNSKLKLKTEEVIGEEIKTGYLICFKSNCKYKIIDFIPRFVKNDKYVDSFSMEWRNHQQTQLDSFNNFNESESLFFKHTGFNKNKIKNHLVLDVGCGIGRFSEVVSKYGGEIIGIDLSYSVDSAFKNIGLRKNVHIVQADIFNLPFKKEIFDNIFSIGVLHHTYSTKKAFFSIVKFLKKGGKIAIAVYSNEGIKTKIGNFTIDFFKFFTKRMKKETLYSFCKSITPLFMKIRRNRFLGFLVKFIPLKVEHNNDYNTLELFDQLSPKYQKYHTYFEVETWFKKVKLNSIKRNKTKVSVIGSK